MKFQILIFFCIALCTEVLCSEVWEFGQSIPTSTVIAHDQGEINVFEKFKAIPITVPPCKEIDYVRVEVNNLISNPAVTYNKLTNVVNIQYKPLQVSISSYDIVAKAKDTPWCLSKTPVHSNTLELVYGK